MRNTFGFGRILGNLVLSPIWILHPKETIMKTWRWVSWLMSFMFVEMNSTSMRLFKPYERERVLSIPLSDHFPSDSAFWDLKHWNYSVKSSYHAISRNANNKENELSSNATSLWKMIWYADICPCTKILACGACHDAIKRSLCRCILSFGCASGICGTIEELPVHALQNCIIALEVWKVSCLFIATFR